MNMYLTESNTNICKENRHSKLYAVAYYGPKRKVYEEINSIWQYEYATQPR